MSRLSRFKKGPSLKLPKKLPQRGEFEGDSSSDDDDDFVTRPTRTREPPSSKKVSPKKQPGTYSSEPSVSEYFQPCTSSRTARAKSQAVSNEKVEYTKKEKADSHKENIREEKRKTPTTAAAIESATKKKQTSSTSCKVSGKTENEEIPTPIPDASDNESEAAQGQGKVVCPFCCKKLGDKLSGTTHVKACAKDLPIQTVFEAMQLQEKQIQEWEKLGLDYPGFPTLNNKKTKNATRGRGGGGRARKKAVETGVADPEFELAVALSMSLHEEFESRSTKENQFLIENGLEKEIGLVEIKKPAPIAKNSDESTTLKPAKTILAPPFPSGRRRGKKQPLDQLPLYTVGVEQKKAIIGERVTKILNESEETTNEPFYIRKAIPPNMIGVPKRLVQFQDKESTLWSRAQGSLDIPNESFSVLEMPDPKDKLEMTSCPTPNGIEACPSEDNPSPDRKSLDRFLNVNQNLTESEKIVDECRPIIQPSKSCESKRPDADAGLSKVESTGSKSEKNSLSSTTKTQHNINMSAEPLKSLPRVIQDITAMMVLRKYCDLVLYGREEKPIFCHSFMFSARCPKLLKDVIEETSGRRTRRAVSLTSFSHKTVKSFVWYVYTGKVDFSQNEDLAELRDLAETYDMSLAEAETTDGQSSNTPLQYNTAQVQTDMVPLQDASTMTENQCSLEPGLDSLQDEDCKESQEMFTTFYEENGNGDDSGDKKKCEASEKGKNQASPLVYDDDDASENEDALSDVDLFEDIEKEVELFKLTQMSKSKVSPPDEARERSHFSPPSKSVALKEKVSVDSVIDEDFMEGFAPSPITQVTAERKRSRSVSPVEYVSGDLYSATQIAQIFHMGKSGDNSKEYAKKAIKKQRLDYSDIEMICDEKGGDIKNAEEDGFDCSGNSDSDKWNDDSVLCKMVDDVSYPQKTVCTTPKSNLLKSRRSISTPNLSIKSPNNFTSVPFYPQQNSDYDDETDPFANAGDDSVFANIPDEILAKTKTPEVENSMSTFHKHVDVSKCTSQRNLTPHSHSRRKIAPKDLSKCDDSFSTTTTEAKKGKGRANGKAKAPPKIKLPKRQPQPSQTHNEFEFGDTTHEVSNKEVTRRPTPPNLLAESMNGNCKSPMLNYSLIDTPILKQELKKYGIKPLPRSKAKVLLRHIYKETHK